MMERNIPKYPGISVGKDVTDKDVRGEAEEDNGGSDHSVLVLKYLTLLQKYENTGSMYARV